LPFLEPPVWIKRLLDKPERGIGDVKAKIDEGFGAAILEVPHRTTVTVKHSLTVGPH